MEITIRKLFFEVLTYNVRDGHTTSEVRTSILPPFAEKINGWLLSKDSLTQWLKKSEVHGGPKISRLFWLSLLKKSSLSK